MLNYEAAIRDSWRSLRHKHLRDSLPVPFALVPRKCSDDGNLSTSLMIDLDAHGDGWDDIKFLEYTARKIYANALEHLSDIKSAQKGVFTVVWEHSGRGFHVVVVTRENQNLGWWKRLAAVMLSDCECSVEVFGVRSLIRAANPPGFRMIGNANPSTWAAAAGAFEVSRIIKHHGLADLCDALPEPPKEKPFKKPDEWLEGQMENWVILEQSSRHNQLAGLIGSIVYQAADWVCLELAKRQFEDTTIAMEATLREHLNEAQDMLNRFRREIVESMNDRERRAFLSLRTDPQRAAFTIVRNFATENDPFFFPVKLVGNRVGIGWETVRDWRRDWARKGWIRRVRAAVAMQRAARYRWELA